LRKSEIFCDDLAYIETTISIGVNKADDPMRAGLSLFLDRLLDPCRLGYDQIPFGIPCRCDRPLAEIRVGDLFES
jgi:hypothetical protein